MTRSDVAAIFIRSYPLINSFMWRDYHIEIKFEFQVTENSVAAF